MSEEKKDFELKEGELEKVLGGYIPVQPISDDDFGIIKFIKQIIIMFNELEKAGMTRGIAERLVAAYKTGGKEAAKKMIMQEITNPELRTFLLESLEKAK